MTSTPIGTPINQARKYLPISNSW